VPLRLLNRTGCFIDDFSLEHGHYMTSKNLRSFGDELSAVHLIHEEAHRRAAGNTRWLGGTDLFFHRADFLLQPPALADTYIELDGRVYTPAVALP